MPVQTYVEEKQLVAACVQGNEAEWNRFVRTYDRRIRYVVALVCMKQGVPSREVEDIAAYVYLKLLEDDCRRLRAWRGQSSFATFLGLVAHNLSVDYLKKHNKGFRVQTDGDVALWAEQTQRKTDAPPLRDWEVLALKAAVGKLPPKQAMIMQLRLDGLSLRRIARLMNIPKGTVFGENARALEALRVFLDPDAPGRVSSEE